MQENPQIPTTPPLSGADAIDDINDALQTLATDFSGDVDPAAYAWPYSKWVDTLNGLIKRRNAANSAWIVEGRLLARPQQQYDQGDEPTTDQGDIWINGIGPCRWNITDSKYYRIPYTTKLIITSSQTITLDVYTPKIRVSGCAAGGGGGSGGGGGNGYLGSGAGGGGAGQSVIDKEIIVTPGQSISVTIGAGGAGGPANTTGFGSGNNGSAGGNTTLGSLLTLTGGGAGARGVSVNTGAPQGGASGAGYPSGASGMDGSTAGASANTGTASGGEGGSTPFGGGGSGGAGRNSGGISGGTGGNYGSGGGGGGGYAYGTTQGAGGAGGNGANSFLIVEY